MTAAKDEAVANAARMQVLAPPTKAAITGYVTLPHLSIQSNGHVRVDSMEIVMERRGSGS
jgi:hypothetical protein